MVDHTRQGPRPEPADRVIARIASRQHGVVARRQLLRAGVSPRAIEHRVAMARLHPVHRGVYLVGHPHPAPHALDLAAVLACGDHAVRSHQSAGVAWRMLPAYDGPVEITVVRSSTSRTGIRVHRSRTLERAEIRLLHAMPTTSPARTLFDIAGAAPTRRLERAVDEGIRLGLVRSGELNGLLNRWKGHRGATTLRDFLHRRHGPALTRSEAEERLLELVRKAGLLAPRVNARVGAHEVDFLWPRERLIVEVDGYAFHSSRTAFERDRRRDTELQAAGYRVLRVTWRQLVEEPEVVLVRLAQALATRTREVSA